LGDSLSGKQIATTIFEYMNIPKYNPTIPEHLTLAEISVNTYGQRKEAIDKSFPEKTEEKRIYGLVINVTLGEII